MAALRSRAFKSARQAAAFMG
ncbi:hypothetical protein, partial [Halomonas sp. KAO]